MIKLACEQCIRGHRSTKCNHSDRPQFQVRPKGRPQTQCPDCRALRQGRDYHVRCDHKPPSSDDNNLVMTRKRSRLPRTKVETAVAGVGTTTAELDEDCGCGCGKACSCMRKMLRVEALLNPEVPDCSCCSQSGAAQGKACGCEGPAAVAVNNNENLETLFSMVVASASVNDIAMPSQELSCCNNNVVNEDKTAAAAYVKDLQHVRQMDEQFWQRDTQKKSCRTSSCCRDKCYCNEWLRVGISGLCEKGTECCCSQEEEQPTPLSCCKSTNNAECCTMGCSCAIWSKMGADANCQNSNQCACGK